MPNKMSSPDHHAEFVRLLDELDRLAEEQRVIDTRDPNALAKCEHKLEELRRRIERLQRPKGHRNGSRPVMTSGQDFAIAAPQHGHCTDGQQRVLLDYVDISDNPNDLLEERCRNLMAMLPEQDRPSLIREFLEQAVMIARLSAMLRHFADSPAPPSDHIRARLREFDDLAQAKIRSNLAFAEGELARLSDT
jgi:hypothetical protein